MGEQGDTEESRRTVVAGGAFTTQSTMQQAGSKATGAYKDNENKANQTASQSVGSTGGGGGSGHPFAQAEEKDHATGEAGGGEGSDSKET